MTKRRIRRPRAAHGIGAPLLIPKESRDPRERNSLYTSPSEERGGGGIVEGKRKKKERG